MYYKYRGYVYNRTRGLPLEDREDIYSELYSYIQDAKRTYLADKGTKQRTWFFRYLKSYTWRLIQKAKRRINNEIDIDGLDEGSEYIHNLFSDSIDAQYYLEERMKNIIKDMISILPDDYKFILIHYYGLEGKEPKTLGEISKLMRCTSPNCKMKLIRAIRRLRARVRNNEKYKNIGEFLDYEA